MDFMNALANNSKSKTTNGATQYTTSGNTLVDLNFSIPSIRKCFLSNNKQRVFNKFGRALYEDTRHTLMWLMYLRDINNGAGERLSYREFLQYIAQHYPQLTIDFIMTTKPQNYGRWDDLLSLINVDKDNVVHNFIIGLIKTQLNIDLANAEKGRPVSLLGKWMPSANTSSRETRLQARKWREALGVSSKYYRKSLSKLRKAISIVETKLTEKRYSDINYEAVPSKAGLRYKNAFVNHDADRYTQYIEEVKAGTKKINANSMFLYEIVHQYTYKHLPFIDVVDDTLEEMWKAQTKLEGFSNTLVVRDGSFSMTSPACNSKATCLDVADAFTLYCSQFNKGMYKDKFITFSEKPRVIDLSMCKNLREKLNVLGENGDCTNTNLEAVFMLILETAVKNHAKQEDLPKQILIISDMQFDFAVGNGWNIDAKFDMTLLEDLANRFKQEGYTMPKLIFWNVSEYDGVPMRENELGLILLSGFSKSMFNMALSSEVDPLKALYEELEARCSIVDSMKSFELK